MASTIGVSLESVAFTCGAPGPHQQLKRLRNSHLAHTVERFCGDTHVWVLENVFQHRLVEIVLRYQPIISFNISTGMQQMNDD